jgi:hypothetical protein
MSQFIKKQRLFTKEVMKDINKKDKKLRQKAARHLKSKIAQKINKTVVSKPGDPPGMRSGNLKKGLRIVGGPYVAYVGIKKPGYHASILEFGKSDRTNRPFLFPTFAEEKDAVRRILSEKRV